MIHAHIRARTAEAERRWQVRRDVSIATSAHGSGGGYDVIVRNLSENGLLMETDAPLGPRDTFVIALPDHGECDAEVIWAKGDLKGCRFFMPIPRSVVSGAVLRSPVEDGAALHDELRNVRLAVAEAEQQHMPTALSVPALVFLLSIEVAVLLLLLG